MDPTAAIVAPILAGLSALLLGVVGYAYLGYPLLVRLLVRPPRDEGAAPTGELPAVTVVVAARNEAPVIEARVRDLLSQDYPADRTQILVVSDASDDGTDEVVQGIDDPRVDLLRLPHRAGKTQAVNHAITAARGDVVVQTDANVMFQPGALRSLARALQAEGVGIATGEVQWTNADDPVVAGGEGLYWRFESWSKRVQARRGMLVVASGGIYAMRRSLWEPLPPPIAGDAADPLRAARAGYRTVVAEGAVAHERAAASLTEEYRRKVRIIAQQVACARWLGIHRLPPRTALAYVSHKLLRYVAPLAQALSIAAGAASAALGFLPGAGLAAVGLLPWLMAPVGLLPLPGVLGRITRVPLYYTMISAAAVVGLVRGLRGRAQTTWDVAPSTRQQ